MNKFLTQEQFLDRAKSRHGDKYNYSATQYVSSRGKIIVICSQHGKFEVIAANHLAGAECRRCSYGVWSAEEEQYLRENYHSKTAKEHSIVLGRSFRAIHMVACKLGLAKPKRVNPYQFLSCGFMNNIISGAKSRNLIFDITERDILFQYDKQNYKCALTGQPIELYKNAKEITGSVDRIDSSKGYTVDNIQIVHKLANRIKSNLSDHEFFELCAMAYHHLYKRYHPDNRDWLEDD